MSKVKVIGVTHTCCANCRFSVGFCPPDNSRVMCSNEMRAREYDQFNADKKYKRAFDEIGYFVIRRTEVIGAGVQCRFWND